MKCIFECTNPVRLRCSPFLNRLVQTGYSHSCHLSTKSISSFMSTKRQCPSYRYIEDVERLDYYRPGGYHPININDTVHNRYRIVHKLGHGTYSTTWLARDDRFQKYVAIKIGTSESRTPEIQTLAQLNQSDPATCKALLPPILDHFTVQGPNGTHPCYVTAPARISIADAKEASYNGLFRIETARALAAQLASAVAHTHSQGYIHGGRWKHHRQRGGR